MTPWTNVAALACSAVVVAPNLGARRTIDSLQTRTATLFVAVNGNPTSRALGPADFTLRIDGVTVPIQRVTPSPQPVASVIVLDQSDSVHVSPERFDRLVRRVAGNLRHGDRIRFVTAAEALLVAGWTTGPPDAVVRAAQAVYQRGGPSPYWDGLDRAIAAFDSQQAPQRAVLLFTDAQATGNDKGFDEVRRRMLEQRVSLYVVGLHDADFPYVEGVRNAELESIANETGGLFRILRPGSRRSLNYDDVANVFAEFIDEIRHRFRLEFEVEAVDDALRKISVTVNVPGALVRTAKAFR
jgi:hypothetical protein